MACCAKCLEDILEYLNKIAYAYMAITGDKYCTAAWNAFIINLKNATQFYLCNYMAGVFVGLGTFMCILLNVLVFHAILMYGLGINTGPDSLAPVMVAYLIAFIISAIVVDIFLGLFDEAVLATIHCYALDVELNGTASYGPPTFHQKLAEIMATEEWKKMTATDDDGEPGANEPPKPAAMMAPAPGAQPGQPGMMMGGPVQGQMPMGGMV